jgi:hypothetical protein
LKCFAAQHVVLGGHAGGAVVQVADAQVLAAHGDHRRGAEAEALGAEDGGLDHIQAGLQAAVGLQAHLVAQIVGAQHLVGFGQTELPGLPAYFTEVSGLAPVPPS